MGRYAPPGRLDRPTKLLLIKPFAAVFVTCLCIWIALELNQGALLPGSLQLGALGLLDDWARMPSQERTTTVATVSTVVGECARTIIGALGQGGGMSLAWGGWSRFHTTVPHSEAIVAAVGTLVIIYVVRRGTRRYRTATQLPPQLFQRGRQLGGFIVTVNDSDNVRFYHCAPWQRALFWKRPGLGRGANLKEETINVRLAGIDAPEMGHFGGTPQPFSREAKEWLARFTMGKRATIQVHRLDQYARAVASVHVWGWGGLWRRNVSLAMAQAGYAAVYVGAGAEYGGIEAELRAAEAWAQRRKLGMWAQSGSEYISPAAYKKQQIVSRASA